MLAEVGGGALACPVESPFPGASVVQGQTWLIPLCHVLTV